MTQQQRKRLGLSETSMALVKLIRAHELANSGVGPLATEIVPSDAFRWYNSLQSLVRRGMVRVAKDGRVTTHGVARQVNSSWGLSRG